MSHVEKITAELRTLATGVERAQSLASAAEQQTQEIGLRAAGAGFAAVAAGVARIRGAIATLWGGLGGLAGAVGDATKATAGLPQQASPGETINGLTPVKSAVDGIRDQTAATIMHVGEAQQLVVAVLQGGQPGQLLQALESVKQVLVVLVLVQRTATTHQVVDVAIAEARQLGSSGN
ncbi:DUF6244 family protein [Micromonospora humida]|uniref:DUF6244 family protein n=1 Tax=Micromonospora humida TaxID=2809018 RepID=UPI003438D704